MLTISAIFLFVVVALAAPSTQEFKSRFLPESYGPVDKVLQSAANKPISQEFFATQQQRTPVVIVPSLIGTRLEAKTSFHSTRPIYCGIASSWYTIWVNVIEALPGVKDCFALDISLLYNSTDKSYSPPHGVQTRCFQNASYHTAPFESGLDSIEYLDGGHKVGVWNTTVELLVKYGYTRGVDVVGAPYDWRIGPQSYYPQERGFQSDPTSPYYFERLAARIELTYKQNNNRSVALVSLSMGGPVTSSFLAYMPQGWKDRYIDSFTSLSGAFGGSSFTIGEMFTRNNSTALTFGLSPEQTVTTAKSWGSIWWMLPTAQSYNASTPVLNVQGKTYTINQYPEMFTDAGVESSTLEQWKDMQSERVLKAPGVKTHCVYGTEIPTANTIVFDAPLTKQGKVTYDFTGGDGTVTNEALSVPCAQWAKTQSPEMPVTLVPYFNMTHGGAVKDPRALGYFLKVLGLTPFWE